MAILHRVTDFEQKAHIGYNFHCPGCGCGHFVTINGHKNSQGATWQFSGTEERPTFNPSILCNKDEPEHRCHSFVREGIIQFLGDCFHALAGQTVPLPEWED